MYVTPPHEPYDHWRPTINADVHRRVGPGTKNSQGKGEGGGRSLGSVSVLAVCCIVVSAKQRYHLTFDPNIKAYIY